MDKVIHEQNARIGIIMEDNKAQIEVIMEDNTAQVGKNGRQYCLDKGVMEDTGDNAWIGK
jgi:hypothetical protein